MLGIVQGLINLVLPDWLRVMVVYRALTVAAWIVILFFLIKAGHWVILAPTCRPKATAALRRLLCLSRPSSESLEKRHA
jgi:hypothetical protein